jgi:phage terminase large subunit GpA-like protein
MDPTTQTILAAVKLWEPPPRLTLSQWADKYRHTSGEASSEIGEWITRPYQVEPMNAFTDPHVRNIVIQSAVQMLKTEFILNAIGYVIHLDQGPVLVLQFRDTDCEIFSKRRLAPMLRDTPILKGLVADSRGRDSNNTITDKPFAGGHIRIAASASPGNLAALPIRYLFCDEVDKYPISSGGEGDPITVAEGRLEEFAHSSKEILTCSPTRSGISRIEKAYLDSDQRVYEVPCPHCGGLQELWGWSTWINQVRWDSSLPSRKKQADSAYYECLHCKAHWTDADRWKAVYAGKYRATAPFNGVAGFRISALCSLKKRLSEYVAKYLKVKDDQEQRKVFVNTILAETWTEPGEQLDHETLIERREDYAVGTVPDGGLFLAASVDVQREDGGRLEVRVNAYGENRERWAVDYRIFPGDPTDMKTWEPVESMLRETWPTVNGAELPIERMFVDSGDGAVTPFVYEWVKRQPRPRVWAIKGDKRSDTPVGQPKSVEVTSNGKKLKFGVVFKIVNSDYFKAQFYADLRKRKPTPDELATGIGFPQGYFHIPADPVFGDEHCKQICAERLITVKRRNGRTVSEWDKTRPRNEALDTQVYADAAAWDFGVHRFQSRHWAALREKVKSLEPAVVAPAAQQQQQPQQQQPLALRRKVQIRLN